MSVDIMRQTLLELEHTSLINVELMFLSILDFRY